MVRLIIPLKLMISTANTTTHLYNLTKNFSMYKLDSEFRKLIHLIFEYKKNITIRKFPSSIRKDKKGGLVLKGNSSFTPRFSNVVLVLVSLLVLFLGFEIMREREFLKFLSSKFSKFWVFISITFSLVILFTLCLLVISACCIGLTLLQGISLTPTDFNGLVIALVPMILNLLFFFFTGTIMGIIRSKYTGIPGLLDLWIIFIFIYPAAINCLIEEKFREITSSYNADSDKWKKITDFENRAAKKAGESKDNTVEGRREVAEDFWKNERKQIEAVDEKLKQEISQRNKRG